MLLDLSSFSRVYCLGIGGMGMSALARYFYHTGKAVLGYDRTPTPLTEALMREGISIHFTDSPHTLPFAVTEDLTHTLVVYTPALPADHSLITHLQQCGASLYKRAVVLGAITAGHATVAVAGTHGKTTTTALISHFLEQAGVSVVGLLGGLLNSNGKNLVTNWPMGSAPVPGKDKVYFVVEADEYDRSFLQLYPSYGVVTAVEADHQEIYHDEAALWEGFHAFVHNISTTGRLLAHQSIAKRLTASHAPRSVKSYALQHAPVHADRLLVRQDRFVGDYVAPADKLLQISFPLPGRHNVENTLAAITVARDVGVTPQALRRGLASFRGIQRRFTVHVRGKVWGLIDDYAHHPTEVQAFLQTVRCMYPNRRLLAIFQPHLFTRTRDHALGLGKTLSLADEVWLLPIYPAREAPLPYVTSALLLPHITVPKVLCSPKEVLQRLRKCEPGLVLTIGAGDISDLVPQVAHCLNAMLDSND